MIIPKLPTLSEFTSWVDMGLAEEYKQFVKQMEIMNNDIDISRINPMTRVVNNMDLDGTPRGHDVNAIIGSPNYETYNSEVLKAYSQNWATTGTIGGGHLAYNDPMAPQIVSSEELKAAMQNIPARNLNSPGQPYNEPIVIKKSNLSDYQRARVLIDWLKLELEHPTDAVAVANITEELTSLLITPNE